MTGSERISIQVRYTGLLPVSFNPDASYQYALGKLSRTPWEDGDEHRSVRMAMQATMRLYDTMRMRVSCRVLAEQPWEGRIPEAERAVVVRRTEWCGHPLPQRNIIVWHGNASLMLAEFR